jgi:endonuclease/exonuclease/phosphatase family metal-dependent hydrolase
MKVISLNIEGNKHYELVLPFLHTENPDVICLQEVLEDDVNMFFSEFPEMIGTFKPFTYYGSKHERYASMSGKIFGNLVLAKNAYTTDSFYYWGSEINARVTDELELIDATCRQNYSLVYIKVKADKNKDIVICTTHFPVTEEGESTPHQLEIIEPLSIKLKEFENFVLCGDFNAPRGGETFGLLTKMYKDNIPEKYMTSLDQNLHRVKGLQYMVDGCFSSGDVNVTSVKLCDGVSDHMAVVAIVN